MKIVLFIGRLIFKSYCLGTDYLVAVLSFVKEWLYQEQIEFINFTFFIFFVKFAEYSNLLKI